MNYDVMVAQKLCQLYEDLEKMITECHKQQDYQTAHILRMTDRLRDIVCTQSLLIDELMDRIKKLETLTEPQRRAQEAAQAKLDQEERDKRDEERWLAELVKEDEKLRREMKGF